jgi:hypothetical protein
MPTAFASRAARTALLATEIAVLAWLFATEDLHPLGVFLLILGLAFGVLAIVFGDWPIGCVAALVIGSAMPTFSLKVSDLHARPEHVATSVAILAIAVQLLMGRIRLNLQLRNFDYWLLAYVALNFFSSTMTSPKPAMTLRWAVLNALVVIPYFLIRVLVRNDRHVWLALHALLCVGVGEAIYGSVAYAANHIWGTTWGVQLGQYGSYPGVFGTQYEANLFGSYTACTALMFLTLFLLSNEPKRIWYACGVTLGLVGAFISLARSVLLALPVPVVILLWVSFKKGHFQLRRLLPIAIGVALVLVMLSPLLLDYAQERFSTLGVSDDSTDYTTAGRLLQMEIALENVSEHPLFGQGTSSFQLLFRMSDLGIFVNYEDDDIGWISNTPVRVLHDTGVVGLVVFLIFLGTLARYTFRAIGVATRRTKMSIVALSAGLLLYAITFQATEATLLTFTWIHLGLLAAAATVALDGAKLPEMKPA